MLGTVPQHKERGDTNSYGWNWKRSAWFPVCNPNMTNRKWTSIYRVLLYFNWSPEAFFHMKYWEKNTATFWLADDLLYFLSHLTAGITVIVCYFIVKCVVLFQKKGSKPKDIKPCQTLFLLVKILTFCWSNCFYLLFTSQNEASHSWQHLTKEK